MGQGWEILGDGLGGYGSGFRLGSRVRKISLKNEISLCQKNFEASFYSDFAIGTTFIIFTTEALSQTNTCHLTRDEAPPTHEK